MILVILKERGKWGREVGEGREESEGDHGK